LNRHGYFQATGRSYARVLNQPNKIFQLGSMHEISFRNDKWLYLPKHRKLTIDYL